MSANYGPVPVHAPENIIPTKEDFEKLLSAKLSYESAKQAASNESDFKEWTAGHFTLTPWGIGYGLSFSKHEKATAFARKKGWADPKPKTDVLLRYFIAAIAIGWDELVEQLTRTLKLWGYKANTMQTFEKVWKDPTNLTIITANLTAAQQGNKIKITEAVEKHKTLNSKLFTKDLALKEKVRQKLLEIVDVFLQDLKDQGVKIKVDDILFVGSNASYNYTKDSDIDLHILANAKAVDYDPDIANALYSAYRSLFNKQLDITFFGTPVEMFVELEDSKRVSNGIYSVKKDKWVKQPEPEAIPEYDHAALKALVSSWEERCDKLIAAIEEGKVKDEKRVVKLIEDIYEKLRKKGIAKGEYSIENLAFKELRNSGYLDKFKDYKNELLSKRLSLEENTRKEKLAEACDQLSLISGGNTSLQDDGKFYVYDVKAHNLTDIVNKLRAIPVFQNVCSQENGKYDFSKMAQTNLPTKYYNICGYIVI